MAFHLGMIAGNRRRAIWLFAVFAAGIVLGVAGTRAYLRIVSQHAFHEGPDASRRIALEMLQHELRLSSEQLEKIQPIALEFQKRLIEIRLRNQPAIFENIDRTLSELRPLLDEPQRQRLDERAQELKSRWSRDAEWVERRK